MKIIGPEHGRSTVQFYVNVGPDQSMSCMHARLPCFIIELFIDAHMTNDISHSSDGTSHH